MFKQGPVSMTVVGTGSLIPCSIGYLPSIVEFESDTIWGEWNEDLEDGGFIFKSYLETLAGDIALGNPQIMRGTSSLKTIKHKSVGALYAASASALKVYAGAEVAFTATTHDITAAKWRAFLLAIPTAGTAIIIPGTEKATWALARAAVPALTALHAPIGLAVIPSTSLAAIFDATTDDVPATATYHRFGGILSGGISIVGRSRGDTYKGFSIGTNGNLNILGQKIRIKAYRD